MNASVVTGKLSFVHRCSYRPGNESTRPLQALRSKKSSLLPDDLRQADDIWSCVQAQKLAPYLKVLECFMKNGLTAQNVTEITHVIRSINVGLSNRISSLWSIRESNTNVYMTLTESKYLMMGLLRSELDHVLSLFRRSLSLFAAQAHSQMSVQKHNASAHPASSFCSSYQLLQFLQLLRSSVDRIIPSLLIRLDNFVVQTVRETTTESMRQYCMQHPRDFLVLQRTHSVVLHSLLKVCGLQSTHTKRSVHSEQVIVTLLRQHSLEPLRKSISLVTRNAQLIQHYVALGINSTLRFFLDYLLVHRERFDEPGVYQLFRTLLKLQEYISEVKKNLNFSATEKFIVDANIWKKAECIVQVLNSAVFSVKQHKNKQVNHLPSTQCNNSISATEGTVQYLTEEEKVCWRGLVGNNSNNRLGSRFAALSLRRQRHSGTVFVTLELDFKNL